MSFASYVAAIPNLKLWFKLGEASGTVAADSAGGGHNGVYTGTWTLGQTALGYGDAGDKSAKSGGGKVVVADTQTTNPAINPLQGLTAITVVCAFRTPASVGSNKGIVAEFGSGGNRYLIWVDVSGKVAARVYSTTGAQVDMAYGTALAANTDYVFAFSHKAGRSRAYVAVGAGTPTKFSGDVTTLANNLAAANTSQGFLMGCYSSAADFVFDGYLKHVIVVSGEMSDTDVLALMAAYQTPPTNPPGVPTSVTTGTITTSSVGLSWSAPASGGAPTSYEVQVNSGTPVSLSAATFAYTFTGLAGNTAYDLRVRAVNADGSSAYVTHHETTLDGVIAWIAQLRIGAGFDALSWTFERGDEPTTSPFVLAGVTFTWASPQDRGWPAPRQLEPFDTLTLSLYADDAADIGGIAKGDVVRFTFRPTGYTDLLVDFAGTITGDPQVRHHPTRPGVTVALAASDHRYELANHSTILTGTSTLALSGDLIADALEDLCATLGYPNLWAPTEAPAGSLIEDVIVDGAITDLGAFQLFGVTPIPNYDPVTGELDPTRPYLFDGFGAIGGAITPSGVEREVPSSLVLDATLEWRRDYEPNYWEGPDGRFWLGDGRSEPDPAVHRSARVGRRPLAIGPWPVNPTSLALDYAEPDAWGPVRFDVIGYLEKQDGSSEPIDGLDPSVVAGWFIYPDRVDQYVRLTDVDNTLRKRNPNGTDTVAGMLGQASLTILEAGGWFATGYLRRSHAGEYEP